MINKTTDWCAGCAYCQLDGMVTKCIKSAPCSGRVTHKPMEYDNNITITELCGEIVEFKNEDELEVGKTYLCLGTQGGGTLTVNVTESLHELRVKSEVEHLMRSISKRRREQEYTQTQLAKETGLSQSTISEFERGKRYPTIETLAKLAIALNLQIELIAKR